MGQKIVWSSKKQTENQEKLDASIAATIKRNSENKKKLEKERAEHNAMLIRGLRPTKRSGGNSPSGTGSVPPPPPPSLPATTPPATRGNTSQTDDFFDDDWFA